MKRTKTLISLGIVLVCVCVGIVVVKGVEKHIDSINTIDEEILSIDANELKNVSWEKDGDKLEFVKEENGWQSKDDEVFPVDQEAMADFLDYFSSVHASFIINDVEDYSQYGLSKPEGTISFNYENGDTSTIDFGTFSTMDSKRYISIGNGSVYLIDDDLMQYISSDRDDLMLNDKIATVDQVTKFNVAGDNNVTIIFDDETSHTYTDTLNYYLLKGSDYMPLSASYAKTYINNIKNLSLKEYATYNVSDSELASYGLDNPSLICVIEGDFTEDEKTKQRTSTVTIGCVGEKTEDKDNREIYARVEDSKIIYKIDTATYDALLEGSYDTLRPSEVVSANEEYVTGYSFVVEGNTYTVAINKEDKDEIKYTIDEYEVDITDFKNNIDDLSLSKVDENAATDKLEFEFNVSQDFNGYDNLSVSIYRLDGDSCVVKFNGDIIGLIDRSQMVNLRESATKLVLNLGKDAKE